jgi:hypothetical protein
MRDGARKFDRLARSGRAIEPEHAAGGGGGSAGTGAHAMIFSSSASREQACFGATFFPFTLRYGMNKQKA